MKECSSWNIPASNFAKKTFNPIRHIVENLKIEPHPDKMMIALSIGDPTVFGNLKPAPEVVEAVVESLRTGKNNGYIGTTGTQAAREAIAEYMTCPTAPVDAKDVIICSGCSCSLDLCISVLCDSGSSILVPRPGFPLYTTLAEGFGVTSKFYNLIPEKNWLIDLEHLESQIDHTTAAIMINNPSNPCGSVFPKEHLEDIAALAVKYKIPIIADEIYDHFVFAGQEYHPIASVNPELQVLACGGLTKRFLVPGWRTGWIAVHDRGGALKEISDGLKSLSARIIGSNTIVQGALPTILRHTPQAFFDDTIQHVQSNARLCYESLQQIPGLSPIQPQGAMYMMVGINIDAFPEFSSDLQFVENLVAEQSVFCLPGKCFNIPNFFRVVLTVPEDKMIEACERMRAFCQDHHILTMSVLQGNDSTPKKLKLDANSSDESCDELQETDAIRAKSVIVQNGKSVEIDEQNGESNRCVVNKTQTSEVGRTRSMTNGNTAEKERHANGHIHSNGLGSENDILKKEVAKIQSAMIKECAIRSSDDLVDEMEYD